MMDPRRTQLRGTERRLDPRAARSLLLGALCALACSLFAAPAAASETPSEDTLVTNAPVDAIATGGGYTYLGGNFTMIGPRIGSGMVLDATGNGEPDTADFPEVAGGLRFDALGAHQDAVMAVAADGSGGWFIGGGFTHVGGEPRNRLAHILGDGSLDPPGTRGRTASCAR